MCADSRVSALALACECSSATIALLPVTPGSPPYHRHQEQHRPLPANAAATSPLTVDEGKKAEKRKEG